MGGVESIGLTKIITELVCRCQWLTLPMVLWVCATLYELLSQSGVALNKKFLSTGYPPAEYPTEAPCKFL